MIFDRENFEDLWPLLDPEERIDLENGLEILTLMIEDLASANSQLVLDFRINSEHSFFGVFMEDVVRLSMEHGFDFFSMLQELPDLTEHTTHLIHESDMVDPTLKVQLIHANSILLRASRTSIDLIATADMLTPETDQVRRELMWEFREDASKAQLANIAAMYLISGEFAGVGEKTLSLLVGAVVAFTDSLSRTLSGIDELVATVKAADKHLTPIADVLAEEIDE